MQAASPSWLLCLLLFQTGCSQSSSFPAALSCLRASRAALFLAPLLLESGASGVTGSSRPLLLGRKMVVWKEGGDVGKLTRRVE